MELNIVWSTPICSVNNQLELCPFIPDNKMMRTFYLPPAIESKLWDVFVYEQGNSHPIVLKKDLHQANILIDNFNNMDSMLDGSGHMLHVGGNKPLNVYLGFKGQPDGVSVVFPQHVLGTEHFLATWCEAGKCQCDVISVQNNTLLSIHIKLTNSTGYAFVDEKMVEANERNIEIVKHELEVTRIQSENDLTGSRVQSSGPVAVFCYSRHTGQSDNLIQIPFVNRLSSSYTILEFQSSVGFVRFISVVDSTLIRVQRFKIYLANSGDFYDYHMSHLGYMYIYASANARFMAIQGLWNIGSNGHNVDPLFVVPTYRTAYLLHSDDGEEKLRLVSSVWYEIQLTVSDLSSYSKFAMDTMTKTIDLSENAIFGIEHEYQNISFLAYMYKNKTSPLPELFDYTFVQTYFYTGISSVRCITL